MRLDRQTIKVYVLATGIVGLATTSISRREFAVAHARRRKEMPLTKSLWLQPRRLVVTVMTTGLVVEIPVLMTGLEILAMILAWRRDTIQGRETLVVSHPRCRPKDLDLRSTREAIGKMNDHLNIVCLDLMRIVGGNGHIRELDRLPIASSKTAVNAADRPNRLMGIRSREKGPADRTTATDKSSIRRAAGAFHGLA